MAGNAEAMRKWKGPAVLSFGFRPFFFLGSVWAVIALALWIAVMEGAWPFDLPFAPLDWHVHSLFFGYVPAVVAGFLLTAVPNWTGRLPVVGWPLAALVALWLAGRLATSLPLGLPPLALAAIDMAFPAALGLLLLREIVAGRNWRNLAVLMPVAAMLVGQGLFHRHAVHGLAGSGTGARLALAAVVFLITLIGGRITPSFTRNWLVQRKAAALPAPFGRIDKAALILTVAALAGFVLAPGHPATGGAMAAAGLGLLLRLARWRGLATLAEPLLAVLHIAYLFVPTGFFLLAAATLWPDLVPMSTALHGWTAGAVGLMTLAVMTRASLGHTGRALHAGPATVAIYALAAGGAVMRILAGLLDRTDLLPLAGGLWTAAFLCFALVYAPVLLRPKLSVRAPSAPPARRD